MKVSLIVPAYNELKTLPSLLEKLLQLDLAGEIVIVDDGSSDGTSDYLRGLKEAKVKFLINERNSGKGYSIRQALTIVTGDIIAIQDADLEYDPNDLLRLVEPFQAGAKVVYGSRILQKGNDMSYLRYYLGGRLLTLATNIIFNSRISDEPTGYKLFRSEIIKNLDLQSNGFEFCPEVTAKLLKNRIQIVEIPISYTPRSFAEGKKINWRDGLIAIKILLKYKFSRKSQEGLSNVQ